MAHARPTDQAREAEAFRSTKKLTLPSPPKFNNKLVEREYLKFRLAQAFRIFAKFGFNEGVAGHITVRDPIKTDCFWVNPFGLHFSLIQPSDLLLVDHNGEILVQHLPLVFITSEYSETVGRIRTTETIEHSSLHDPLCTACSAARRPMCGSHPFDIREGVLNFGKKLDILTQDTCAFYEDHVLYSQFRGIVLAKEEGNAIAKALGNKKAAILQNHGILVATDSIEATVFFYIGLEKACQVQLMADAAASGTGKSTVKILPEEALYTRQTNGTLKAGYFQGQPEFEQLEALEGKYAHSIIAKDSVKSRL